jgi:3-oxoadipate enol-lactonase
MAGDTGIGDNRRVTSPAAALVRYHDVVSADGTQIRAWTNGVDGPTVLLSNGLGTGPHAWPSLLRADCGIHVVGWNHRGTGGSARPADDRVDLESFIEDAIAVMDDAGIESCVVAAWSTGVTIAFELAARHPGRVTGILAVAGVPGNTFSTMLAPLHVPPVVGRGVMVGVARSATVAGHALAPLTRRLPWTNLTADLVRRTRIVFPEADTAELRTLLQEFFTTHPAWYARLALSVSRHARVSLSDIDVPVTFVAGTWDVLTGARSMRTAAQRVKGSRYRELDATHFIPVEFPDIVLDELRASPRAVGPSATEQATSRGTEPWLLLRRRRHLSVPRRADLGETVRDRPAGHLRRVPGPQVLRGQTSSLGGQRQVVEDLADESCRRLEVRIGPRRARRVRSGALGDRDRRVRHQVAVLVRHELHVAAVRRGDHGLAHGHRLGHGQPQSLGPVQRDVAVAGRHQRVAVVRAEVVLDEQDVGRTRHPQTEPLGLGRAPVAADGLDDQQRPLARLERGLEGVHQAPGILALGDTRIVEREQQDRTIGQAHPCPGLGCGSGGMIVRTGTGECGSTAVRMKSVATQTSSTCRKPLCWLTGKSWVSQYHMPMR